MCSFHFFLPGVLIVTCELCFHFQYYNYSTSTILYNVVTIDLTCSSHLTKAWFGTSWDLGTTCQYFHSLPSTVHSVAQSETRPRISMWGACEGAGTPAYIAKLVVQVFSSSSLHAQHN